MVVYMTDLGEMFEISVVGVLRGVYGAISCCFKWLRIHSA